MMQRRVIDVIADIRPGVVGDDDIETLRRQHVAQQGHRQVCLPRQRGTGNDHLPVAVMAGIIRHFGGVQIQRDAFQPDGWRRGGQPEHHQRIRALPFQGGNQQSAAGIEHGRQRLESEMQELNGRESAAAIETVSEMSVKGVVIAVYAGPRMMASNNDGWDPKVIRVSM